MTVPSISPWKWNNRTGPSRLIEELQLGGLANFHMPEAIDASCNPPELARILFGRHAVRFQRVVMTPLPGETKRTTVSMRAAGFHTDVPFSGITPHVQVVVCERPAASGGDSLVKDTWEALDLVRSDDRDLLKKLFFAAGIGDQGPTPLRNLHGTIFSLRRGSLAFQKLTPSVDPTVLERFWERLKRVDPLQFRMKPGDVYINDNHRMVHGRTEFSDPGRRLIRILYWFASPIQRADGEYFELAARAAEGMRLACRNQPWWVLEQLGLLGSSLTREAVQTLEQFASMVAPFDASDLRAYSVGEQRILLQDFMLSSLAESVSRGLPTATRELFDTEVRKAIEIINTKSKLTR